MIGHRTRPRSAATIFPALKGQFWKLLLASATGEIFIASDGHQSVRAFVQAGRTGLLVAGFDTGGGDDFFASHFESERRPLHVGTPISDAISFQLSGGAKKHIYALPN